MKTLYLWTIALLWFGFTCVSQAIDPIWTQTYAGTGVGEDVGYAIAFDSNRNVFVAGNDSTATNGADFVVFKYSPTGVPVWTNRYNSSGSKHDAADAITVDSQGNVIAAGIADAAGPSKFVTIKYSNAGVALWTNVFQGPGNGHARDIATDTNSNVFVTGLAGSWCTIKYSPAGTPLWTNMYGTNIQGFPTRLALDGNGNVCVVGTEGSSPSTCNIVTVKYANNGLALWTNYYDGPAGNYDYGANVAVDQNGNVLVVGKSTLASGISEMVTLQYASGGIPLWTNLYKGPEGDPNDAAGAVCIDANGDVLVTGTSHTLISNEGHITTLKYSSDGIPIWTNCFETAGGSAPALDGMALDSSGNAFITGSISSKLLILAYSGNGDLMWTNATYIGRGHFAAVDASDEIVVTGNTNNDGTGDFITLKFPAAPPLLTIDKVGQSVVLSWGNSNFELQASTSVSGIFTNVPGASSPYTNSPVGACFFRLSSE